MNITVQLLALASAATLAASAQAQFVKGNEAIIVKADGSREVATPPLPNFKLAPPCRADNPGCWFSPLLMIETAEGLKECTEYYARPGTCRSSTFGAEKRPRLWIVKVKGEWLQCQRPDLQSTCISLKALPTSLVQ